MPDMITPALEWVLLRQKFYYRNYRMIVLLVFLVNILLLGLLGFLHYQSVTQPVPLYFPTLADGRWLEMPPLDQAQLVLNGQVISEPTAVQGELIVWGEHVAKAAFSWDFTNWRQALQDLREYFTAQAHMNFKQALAESNNIDTIKKKKYVLKAEIVGSSKIVTQGLLSIKKGWFDTEQRYRWILQTPLKLTYENSAGERLVQNFLASMLIIRVSTLESETGLAIAQLVYEEV